MSQKINITNAHLFELTQNPTTLKSMFLEQLLQPKVSKFFKDNAIRIDTLLDGRQKLQEQYFVIDNNEIKHEGEGENRKPVLLEGKSLEDYNKEYQEWCKKENTITV